MRLIVEWWQRLQLSSRKQRYVRHRPAGCSKPLVIVLATIAAANKGEVAEVCWWRSGMDWLYVISYGSIVNGVDRWWRPVTGVRVGQYCWLRVAPTAALVEPRVSHALCVSYRQSPPPASTMSDSIEPVPVRAECVRVCVCSWPSLVTRAGGHGHWD